LRGHMTLTSGTKLGPYEIVSLLGTGGMGEVYRARDSRLKREVAIKVLPRALSLDTDRLRRFEQEALATAALNHPNILAVFDIGTSEGSPYVVSELLEGETLRERLRSGSIPVRKALDYALQIAHGLAAAHEKGIIHRDLKPENLFLTKDGRVKILDFGLAKLTQVEAADHTSLPTVTHGTEAGLVLGTAGYMSPEQVRGIAVDARSDIFSFGVILYEMLSGKRAFHRDTPADTMSAILKEDPPDLSETNRTVSPALERIVRHCLEKNPEQRFHSARDLAFDLEALSTASGSTSPKVAQSVRPRRMPIAAYLAAGVMLIALVFLAGRFSQSRSADSTVPEIHQLTFRRGKVGSARFAPDGQTVVYSAAWEGAPREIFTTSEQSPESRSLDIKDAELLAISSAGQMAVKQHPHNVGAFARPGTLATVPLSGGSPRALLEGVESADWSPDGSQMAVIQYTTGEYSLQYPIGKTLFTAPAWVSHLRISPSGERVAFENHPFGGDEGSAMVAEKSGKVRELSSGWLTLQGLAWSPDETEIWFTGTRVGANRALYAVTLAGHERMMWRVPGVLTLWDIGPQGRVMMSEAYERTVVMALLPGANESDLSWFDYGVPSGLSSDGKSLLIAEVGEGGGAHYTTYLRATDGSPAIRLGEGQAYDLSGDGTYAMSRVMGKPTKMYLLPTQGAPRELAIGDIEPGFAALFVPGTHRILFEGHEPGHKARVYLLDPTDPAVLPRAVVPEGVNGLAAITSDGNFLIAQNEKQQSLFYPVAGGTPQAVPGMQPREQVFGIGSDNRTVFVGRDGELPRKVYRLNAASGERQLWKEIGPADRTGTDNLGNLRVLQDGKAYFYWYFRSLSELYVFRGLK
jgi:eukaryotic-like serine/threonine-protein kinase